ncbi:class I SAM-dependent methyltransferase [Planotetraspora phitsanulokensis]|uniref:Methyltransferase type 11 n=1 Tax=Planotetraspora phitsanulokensis TaxID=575192 RepID=A0A8J3XME3_9ACTN|nr:class I SAM-dependent methyltransferase [Planotetraspora phitsanulokensis]GII41658.1 methyltransferase type 11 [Planotetraspora phitsanulokensis]
MAADRERLRRTFTEDAELYDRARPGYPAGLFDEIPRGSRVLEIGCGTGQATIPLAERGCRIVAIELGEELARFARRKLAGFPDVEVVNAAFEDWPLPPEPFDVVLAATSFHWIDPAVRVAKSADALRPGGTLAVISTHHISGGTNPFFAEVQRCYERFDPDTPPGLTLQPAVALPSDSAEIDASGRFGISRFRRFEWERGYTTAEYLDVLSTYSNHRALPADARAGLLDCIATLIDGRYGGRIVKRYLTLLRLSDTLLPNGR